jgi:ParB/RepB/Spo0J family partition protein
MATELTLIPAPQLAPNGLPAVLNELKMEDGSSFGHFNVTHLVNSPGNRKRFSEDGLLQLAASIREKGVAQPILIRPLPAAADGTPRWEVVAGERRWRSSVMAPINHIPATCRSMTDQEADELQILENLQREDPHPLEEAEGYERMMFKHGYSADQLAERVKKSRAYIYARLKLCALSLGVRESFLDNAISASTALLIARIPVPELQLKALAEILKPDWRGETMSYRAAAAHIEQRYTLDLEDAPFDLKDAKLLATAGNCIKCPKRTGNQPEIYKDAKSADVCTDPDCFAEKKAAHYQRIIVTANKKGIPVLEGDEAVDASPNNWSRDVEFVSEDHHLSAFDRVAQATGMAGSIKKHLAAAAMPAPAKYLKDDDGSVDALYRREDIQAALEKVGACETVEVHTARLSTKGDENPHDKAQKAALKDRQEREEKERRAQSITLERVTRYRKLRAHISALGGMDTPMLRELAKAMVSDYPLPDDLIGDLYDFERDDDAVCAFIDQADYPAIQLLMMDLIVGESLSVGVWDLDDEPTAAYWAVHTMADAVGIEVTPADLAVAGIDVADLEDAVDVRDAIAENIEHLGAVAAHIIDKAPHHLANVEVAANSLGYFYSTAGWQKQAEQTSTVDSTDSATPRKTLTVSRKPAAKEDATENSSGPTISVKKTRLTPAAAWPFPTQQRTTAHESNS